jgi:chromosome segregation ATPase
MLIDLLYMPEYLGRISLFRLRAIFSHMSDMDKCLEQLVKSGRGWEIKSGYLINKIMVREIISEEKISVESKIKKIEEELNVLRQMADTLEKIMNEYAKPEGHRSSKTKIQIFVMWSEKLNTCLNEIRDKEKELKRLRNILEQINAKIEASFIGHG